MSYFHGIPISNVTHVEHGSRRKHNKQKSTESDNELKSHSECKHRRRRSLNNTKHAVDTDGTSKTKHRDQASSPNCKTKRHLSREIDRLVEENKLLFFKLQETSVGPKLKVVELNEKDAILNKLRTKYHKLEKSYNEMRIENDNLNKLLEECKTECRQANFKIEESSMLINCLEREKENLILKINTLQSERNQSSEDVTLLKNVIYRLNVELERYQDKLRSNDHAPVECLSINKSDDFSRADEMRIISESWGKVNIHALGPLLDAYTENLNEKEQLIANYKQEIDIFSGNFKEIVSENDLLNKSVDNLKAKCNKYAEEMRILEEDAIVIKEQNDLLVKQVNLQKQKLQEIHTIYEQKVESMSQDNNKLHKEYLACKTELSNIKGKLEIMNDGYEKLKNNSEKTIPVSIHAAAVDECKRLFEELKSQYESEKRKLNSRIKTLEESQQESEKELIAVTIERDQLKLHIKHLEKLVKRASHKLEHLQTAISTIQISRDSFKRQLNKTTAFCEELVLEQENLISEKDRLFTLLREKEKENEDIQYLGDNITQRMGSLKSQLKCMKKDAEEQLAIVEKQIKMQETNVDQMKLEHQRELHRLKHIISQKDELIRKLQSEKFNTRDNLELVLKTATSDGIKVKDALKNTSVCKV